MRPLFETSQKHPHFMEMHGPCEAWALLEAKAGQVDRMRTLFRSALSANPRSIPTLHAWACQEARLATPESRETARGLFVKCLEVQPGCVQALQAYACLERQQGNLAKARSLLSLALSAQLGNAASLQQAAQVEEALGNAASAHELFVQANRADRMVARRRRGMYESAKEGRQ
ncbi:unnamed protein product [Closterium sp. NIES-65]|nr:unnamed protein product [Closterium sp. NIES-65]